MHEITLIHSLFLIHSSTWIPTHLHPLSSPLHCLPRHQLPRPPLALLAPLQDQHPRHQHHQQHWQHNQRVSLILHGNLRWEPVNYFPFIRNSALIPCFCSIQPSASSTIMYAAPSIDLSTHAGHWHYSKEKLVFINCIKNKNKPPWTDKEVSPSLWHWRSYRTMPLPSQPHPLRRRE